MEEGEERGESGGDYIMAPVMASVTHSQQEANPGSVKEEPIKTQNTGEAVKAFVVAEDGEKCGDWRKGLAGVSVTSRTWNTDIGNAIHQN